MRIVGCNCIGVYNPETGLDTLFQVHERMARPKPGPIAVLSQSGTARASMSHTGFFGGSYDVAAGAFRQAGIIAVDSCEELAAVARALAMQPRARGTGIAMISNGAGRRDNRGAGPGVGAAREADTVRLHGRPLH